MLTIDLFWAAVPGQSWAGWLWPMWYTQLVEANSPSAQPCLLILGPWTASQLHLPGLLNKVNLSKMWFFENCIRHEIQVVEKWMCPFQTSSLCSGGDEYGDPSSVLSASLLPRTLLPSPSQAQSLTHLQVGFFFSYPVLEVIEFKSARNVYFDNWVSAYCNILG